MQLDNWNHLLRLLLVTGMVLLSMSYFIFRPRQTSVEWMQPLEEYSYQLIQEPAPGERNIFFLETSCLLVNEVPKNSTHFVSHCFCARATVGLRLSARAACALEVAASLHPHRPVYLVHTCPVVATRRCLGDAPAFARQVLSLPNVFLWPMPFIKVLSQTPFAILANYSREENLRDLMKFVLLWQYGGTVLDSSVLLLRSLGSSQNFVSSESEGRVGVAAVNWAWDAVGRAVANETVEELLSLNKFGGEDAVRDVLTAVLRKRCHTTTMNNVSVNRCGGFTVLPVAMFNPVPWNQRDKLFDKAVSSTIIQGINNSIGVNTWSSELIDREVPVSSEMAFVKIMNLVCPQVMDNIEETGV